MSSDLETRMEAVVNELSPELRALARQHVKTLLELNVNSFKSLLAVVPDHSFDIKVRVIACWVIGKIRDKRAVRSLLAAFEDQDVSLCWEAAKSLGLLGSKRAIQPLIASLFDAKPVDKRAAAAYALGLIGDNRALEPLLNVLLNRDEDVRVRAEVAEALALLGDARAVPPLINSLRDNSVEVRFWSAFALGELGDKQALPALERLASTDQDSLPGWGSISSEAASAIESIKAKD